ncbi:PepSY domain-containing protein [Mucilaginibacter sp. BT774]|uniref:PepSY-associated TM helix domain-containing protein n=1 Tax=Mucilaginibacter sp. BT774 TaxID=3062276 RepID=UPI002676B796|nr:PepSY-associated TM helix domain-containing protein [Mucilaginibacter sp. BT774]MDO3626551.1 PepSY-associated TM helix domain-containing protein [Mucilaginibacter sp. BT774]
MKSFKKTILFVHRWLGFISGLVVFVVSITGCIFCFQDEIQDAIYSYRKVEVQQKDYLVPSVIKNIALQDHPKATANYIYYYGKDRPAVVIANLGKEGLKYIYVNPYNGKKLHSESLQSNFFVVVEYIHLYLLLPPKIGVMVVGISVLIFLALMITGIILWWPNRKSDRKRSFTIKWNGRWRRVNYDLHNVLGFYATSIAIILAITGLSIAFEWVQHGIYKAANLGNPHPDEKTIPVSDTTMMLPNKTGSPTDIAFDEAQRHSPQAQMFLIYDPVGKKESIGVTAYAKSLHFYKSDQYYFDHYSGKLLKQLPHSPKSSGMKINDMNYDIHVGQILGLPGKIIAFLASLVCASLPITGFIIWTRKRKKPKKNTKLKEIAHHKTHARLATN